jgi:hypothetical protein
MYETRFRARKTLFAVLIHFFREQEESSQPYVIYNVSPLTVNKV